MNYDEADREDLLKAIEEALSQPNLDAKLLKRGGVIRREILHNLGICEGLTINNIFDELLESKGVRFITPSYESPLEYAGGIKRKASTSSKDTSLLSSRKRLKSISTNTSPYSNRNLIYSNGSPSKQHGVTTTSHSTDDSTQNMRYINMMTKLKPEYGPFELANPQLPKGYLGKLARICKLAITSCQDGDAKTALENVVWDYKSLLDPKYPWDFTSIIDLLVCNLREVDISLLLRQVDQLNKENAMAQSELDRYTITQAAIREEIEKVKKSAATASDDYMSQLMFVQEELDRAHTQAMTDQYEHDQSIATFHHELKELKLLNQDLRRQIDVLADRKEKQTQESVAEVQSLMVQIHELKLENTTLRSERVQSAIDSNKKIEDLTQTLVKLQKSGDRTNLLVQNELPSPAEMNPEMPAQCPSPMVESTSVTEDAINIDDDQVGLTDDPIAPANVSACNARELLGALESASIIGPAKEAYVHIQNYRERFVNACKKFAAAHKNHSVAKGLETRKRNRLWKAKTLDGLVSSPSEMILRNGKVKLSH